MYYFPRVTRYYIIRLAFLESHQINYSQGSLSINPVKVFLSPSRYLEHNPSSELYCRTTYQVNYLHWHCPLLNQFAICTWTMRGSALCLFLWSPSPKCIQALYAKQSMRFSSSIRKLNATVPLDAGLSIIRTMCFWIGSLALVCFFHLVVRTSSSASSQSAP